MRTSECKKTKCTAHRYRYISVHDASTMNRSVNFFCPVYWALISTRTDNMAYLLLAFGQFAHRKITAKIMCTVQLLQHLILRCAQRMCTAHNYVQVMHMTYSQAGCFIKRRSAWTKTRIKPVLGSNAVTQVSDLQKETLFKASTLKPCGMVWS